VIHIERDFYTPALKKALAEDTPEEREKFREMLLEYEKTKENRDKKILQLRCWIKKN
jgi:hypothetical protein